MNASRTPFDIRWKGKPLRHWLAFIGSSPLTCNERFLVCQIALELGLSEKQFFERFDEFERAQIIATRLAMRHIEAVQSRFGDVEST